MEFDDKLYSQAIRKVIGTEGEEILEFRDEAAETLGFQMLLNTFTDKAFRLGNRTLEDTDDDTPIVLCAHELTTVIGTVLSEGIRLGIEYQKLVTEIERGEHEQRTTSQRRPR